MTLEHVAIIILGAIIAFLALFKKKPKKPSEMGCGKRSDIYTDEFDDLFRRHAKPLIPWIALKATAWVESRFDPCAEGAAGEIGMFQIMPYWETYFGLKRDDPEQNAELGARVLELEFKRFGTLLKAVAAYNGGSQVVTTAIRAALDAGDRENWVEYLPAAIQNYIETWSLAYRSLGGSI